MAGLLDAIERSDIKNTVLKSAPLLASVLGSPLASVGVSLLAQAFNVSKPDADAIVNAINDDPDADIKLKTLEFNHVETLEKIVQQNFQNEIADRQNARANSGMFKDFLMRFAILVTVGFFGAFIMLFLPIPFDPGEHDLLLVLVGMLASKWQTIIDFFYGSSKSDNQKLKV